MTQHSAGDSRPMPQMDNCSATGPMLERASTLENPAPPRLKAGGAAAVARSSQFSRPRKSRSFMGLKRAVGIALLAYGVCSAFSPVGEVIAQQATANSGSGLETHWSHNGSEMRLEAVGPQRRFYYLHPKPDIPVAPGTLLFEGSRTGRHYRGTAFIFSTKCGPASYPVDGYVTDDDLSVVLRGQAPLRDSNCQVVSSRSDILEFRYIRTARPRQTIAQPQEESSLKPTADENSAQRNACLHEWDPDRPHPDSNRRPSCTWSGKTLSCEVINDKPSSRIVKTLNCLGSCKTCGISNVDLSRKAVSLPNALAVASFSASGYTVQCEFLESLDEADQKATRNIDATVKSQMNCTWKQDVSPQ